MLVNQKSSRIKEPPVGTFRSHSHVLRRHQHAAGGFCSAIVSAASGSAGGGPTFLRDTPHELDRGCWKLSVRRPPPWQPHPARQSILLGSPSGPTDATGTRRYLFAVNPYARSVLAPHQCTCLGGTSGNRWKLLPAVVWWRAWPRTGYAHTLDGPSTSRFPLAPDHVPDLAASATQPMETAPNAGMRTYVHDLPFANLDQRRSAWAGSRKPSERQADHLESDHRSSADVMQYSAKAEVARNDCVPQPHGIRDSPVESDSAASQCHALSAVDFPRSIGTRRLVPTGFC